MVKKGEAFDKIFCCCLVAIVVAAVVILSEKFYTNR